MAQITDQTNLAFRPYASKFFLDGDHGAGNTKASAVRTPRYKFMYYARFILNQQALQAISATEDPLIVKNLKLNDWKNERSVNFLIKKVDRPKIELNTVESNQYNYRRQNYTRTTFQDVTMTLFDTSDNRILYLWINYFRYYFNNARSKSAGVALFDPTSSTTANEFDVFQAGSGLNPPTSTYGRMFFTTIELYAIFGGRAQVTRLISPKITRIDWGTFDSSDSGPCEVTISFKYENIEYRDADVDITSTGLLEEMGLDGRGLEPREVFNIDDPALSKLGQPAPYDGTMPTYAPTQPVYEQPSTIFQQQVNGPYNQVPQSIYVPFIGAIGGATNLSPVISPFGILVFGL